MRSLRYLLGLVCLLLIAGCSSTIQTYKNTLRLAFSPGDGVQFTQEEVEKRPYSLLLVRPGNRPKAQVALAYVEHGQQKWLAEDDAMIILERGRVIRFTGFATDLVFSGNLGSDYLKRPLTELDVGQQWSSVTDWSHGESSVKTTYTISAVDHETVELLSYSFKAKKISEKVVFANGETALNTFWFDEGSGRLLKSRQTFAPFLQTFEFEHISNANHVLTTAKVEL